MFLGIENASKDRFKYLGRTHLPTHNVSAIENFVRAGVTPWFNFMLFDVDCTLTDVHATPDMAERHPDLRWNVRRTEVYSGTALKSRLKVEGLLKVDWRSYGYRMRDVRAELMFRLVRVSLHERALALESLLNRLISLGFARQLHEHFYADAATGALAAESLAIGRAMRLDTVERLREIAAFVAGPRLPSYADARRFAVEQAIAVGAMYMPLRVRVESIWKALHTRGHAEEAQRTRRAVGRVHGHFGIAAGS